MRKSQSKLFNYIKYDRARIMAHMLVTVRKVYRYFEYTSKNTELISKFIEALKDEVLNYKTAPYNNKSKNNKVR